MDTSTLGVTEPKQSLIKKILNSAGFIPLIFFITSIILWAAFISKIYSDKESYDLIEGYSSSQLTPASTVIVKAKATLQADSTQKHDIEIQKIKEVTQQLIKEQQKTALLGKQLKLSNMLKQSIGSATPTDNKYIAAMNKDSLKKYETSPKKYILGETDYFNRIVLNTTEIKVDGIQQQIYQLMEIKTASNYVKTLKKESDVRQNEVRSIILKRGESIWMIAVRAYGDGYQYHKIMTANPQITEKNARFLKPGTIVRVPL